MKKITLTIEISEKSFELLKQLEDGKGAEFRDYEYDSLEEWKEKEQWFKDGIKTEDYFKARNFCDMIDFEELIENDLVDDGDGMAWHRTYYISEKGKKMLEQNKTEK